MDADVVISALKAVGLWVAKNPDIALNAVAKFQGNKKSTSYEEQLHLAEEKINQLGAAALELEEKIHKETEQLRNEVRTLKTVVTVLGTVLGAAIIAITLLAILK